MRAMSWTALSQQPVFADIGSDLSFCESYSNFSFGPSEMEDSMKFTDVTQEDGENVYNDPFSHFLNWGYTDEGKRNNKIVKRSVLAEGKGRYYGEHNKDFVPHGRGIRVYRNGNIYIGYENNNYAGIGRSINLTKDGWFRVG